MSAQEQPDSLTVAPEVAYELFWREMLFDKLESRDILRLVEPQSKEPTE